MSKKVSNIEKEKQIPKESDSKEPIPPIQESLYEAILAKMNTRTVDVEGTLRKERTKPTKRSTPEEDNSPPKETLKDRIIIQSKEKDWEIDEQKIHEISEILSTVKNDREVEDSFGFFEKGDFHPGVGSHTNFSNLCDFLESQSNVFRTPSETETIVEIMKDESGDIRMIHDLLYPGSETYERKIRYFENSVKIEQFGVRISTSKEKFENQHPK